MSEPLPDKAMDMLTDAIAARDLPGTLAALSTAHEPSVIGSERAEEARGREAVEAFFRRIYARPDAFRFEFPQRSWTLHGDVAWSVTEGTVVEPNGATSKPYRLTAVLIRESTGWKLALWSGAEPV